MASYLYLGSAPAYGGQCEAWVEETMFGHTGVYPNPLVAMQSATDAVYTSDPNSIPNGVAVVFGPAPSNEFLGHSGVSLGGGQMKSVWSDGNIEQESIATFSADNHAPLLGYHNFSRGVPKAAPQAGAATTGATPSFLPSFTGITIGPVHLDRAQALLAGGALAAFLLL